MMNMRLNRVFPIIASVVATSSVCFAQGGSAGAKNPFSAPEATIHRAPERMYDLEHLRLDLNVDYPDRLLTATATNTIVNLNNGKRELSRSNTCPVRQFVDDGLIRVLEGIIK